VLIRGSFCEIRGICGLESVKSVVKKCSAFSLAELLIVVAILGILAALVVPEIQGHTQRAKEAAAKDNLRILREAIERYALDHNGIPPGYQNDNPNSTPHKFYFHVQMVLNKDYLPDYPVNPFSKVKTIYIVPNEGTITEGMASTVLFGWIYQPSTKTVKINWPGVDSNGIAFFNY
jgi:prepilin-type N-terminal cleavage/methylation domain-containing protein